MGATFSNPQPEVQVTEPTRQDATDPFNQPQRPPSPSQVSSLGVTETAQSSGGLDMSQLQPKTNQKKQSSINCRSAFQALNLDVVPYWKNTCQIDVDQVNYVWIFSSYTGNGWWFMSPDVNTHVEKLYQRFEQGDLIDESDDNHLAIRGHDFKYNFDKMCQINRSTGTNRTIRRLDMMKVKEIEQECSEQFKKSEFIWMYQAGSSFVPFMANYQEEIEAAHQDYIDNPTDENYLHYNFKYSNGYEYQLNFRKHTQLNRNTGVRRAISRVPRLEIENHPEYQVSAGFGKVTSYRLPANHQPAVNLDSFDGSDHKSLRNRNLDCDSDCDCDENEEIEEDETEVSVLPRFVANNTPFDEPNVIQVPTTEPEIVVGTQLPVAGFWTYRPDVGANPWTPSN